MTDMISVLTNILFLNYHSLNLYTQIYQIEQIMFIMNFVLLFSVFFHFFPSYLSCPEKCFCLETRILCRNAGLMHFPGRFNNNQDNVHSINMDGNFISVINPIQIQNNFPNLQRLTITNNRIVTQSNFNLNFNMQ